MKEITLVNEEANVRKKIEDKIQSGEIGQDEFVVEKPAKRRRWDQPTPVNNNLEPATKKQALLGETPAPTKRTWDETPANLGRWDKTPANLLKDSETPAHLGSWSQTPGVDKLSDSWGETPKRMDTTLPSETPAAHKRKSRWDVMDETPSSLGKILKIYSFFISINI